MIYAPKKFKTRLATIRPIFDYGDYCVTSCLQNADYIGVYTSDGTFPVIRRKVFKTFKAAMRKVTSLCPDNIWYDGNEVLCKITDAEALYPALADHYVWAPGDDSDKWLRGTLGLPEVAQ